MALGGGGLAIPGTAHAGPNGQELRVCGDGNNYRQITLEGINQRGEQTKVSTAFAKECTAIPGYWWLGDVEVTLSKPLSGEGSATHWCKVPKELQKPDFVECRFPVSNGACYLPGEPGLQGTRDMINEAVKEGLMKPERAAVLDCDPRLGAFHSKYIIIKNSSDAKPAAVTLSRSKKPKKCKTSVHIQVEQGYDSVVIGQYDQTLYWCYNNQVVSDWNGACTGSITPLGKAAGWRWRGCTTNDFIPYSLNGYLPGGVHHHTIGNYENVLWFWPDQNTEISIWGHQDGTCDHKQGPSPVDPHC